LGVIGVGSFVFFGLRAHSKKQDLEACKGHCSSDDVNAVRRDQIVGDVSLGVGLCALGAAAYFYFGRSSEATTSPASGWALGARPIAHGGTLSLSAAF
jgi:hypothetical protein